MLGGQRHSPGDRCLDLNLDLMEEDGCVGIEVRLERA